MKHLLTLIFTLTIFTASAQYTASITKVKHNNLCAERGHSVTYTKASLIAKPYTIDTKDSTVTVYPLSTSSTGRCTRCGAEVENLEKEIRVTTWRRVPANSPIIAKSYNDEIIWGYNENRSDNKTFHSNSLNDIKKVATLKNDTLFIHKRIAPFTSLKEQVKSVTTIYYKNKPLVFKTAVFDDAALFSGKQGLEIF